MEKILQRCTELDSAINSALGAPDYELFEASARYVASGAMCEIAWDHARSIRLLMAAELPVSAIGLLRLQYETLVRALWLLHAATDSQVDLLDAPLTPESEKSVRSHPTLTSMLRELDGNAPARACEMLALFKTANWNALNSFAHAGVHPLKLHEAGYPLSMIINIIRNSNGLLIMGGMLLAQLSGNQQLVDHIQEIPHRFADCLPPILPK